MIKNYVCIKGKGGGGGKKYIEELLVIQKDRSTEK